jgi:hypothetical protein
MPLTLGVAYCGGYVHSSVVSTFEPVGAH